MVANLIVMEMKDFDIILGNDWLTHNRVQIDCYTREVCFLDSFRQTTRFKVTTTPVPKILTSKKFAHPVEWSDKLLPNAVIATDKAKDPLLKIPVTCEFPDVFSIDLHGLPPIRRLNLLFELESGTHLISKLLILRRRVSR